MSNSIGNALSTADREIVMSRVFDAPRELVFDAYFDPVGISNWWGPYGFSTTTYEMDARPGGVWRHCMHGPDGRDYQNKVVYLEIERPSRLVYQHNPDEETEQVTFHTVVTFEDEDGKTKLTMHLIFPTHEALYGNVKTYGAVEGLRDLLSRLDDYLTTMKGN
jgi:uncharacterized protein YndB with AHSA1/START domain